MHDLLPTLKDWAPLFQIITGLFTAFILYLSVKTARQLKKTDVRLEKQRKFDAILVAKHELTSAGTAPSPERVRGYCDRFWNLQTDQFKEWRHGMLSSDTFRFWMESRREEWETNADLGGGKTYREGWKDVEERYRKSGFPDFFRIVTDPTGGIDAAFRKYRPNLATRFFRWLLG